MDMLRDSVKAHIEIESLVNGRRDTSQQCAHAREPFITGLLLEDGPRCHGAENNRSNDEDDLPQPEPLQPLEEGRRRIKAGLLQALALIDQVLRALVHQVVRGIWEPKIF